MRLLGNIGSFLVEILVDLGNTHNFLDQIVVEAAKLKIQKDSTCKLKWLIGIKF